MFIYVATGNLYLVTVQYLGFLSQKSSGVIILAVTEGRESLNRTRSRNLFKRIID
jgi:hypothetical protein